MPQQASQLPTGFTWVDEQPNKNAVKPPAAPKAPPAAFSEGAGPVSTLGTELLGPFSAMGSDNKFKVPDVITGLMDTMRRNFGVKENIDSAMNKNVDQRASEVAGRGKQMVQGIYEPSQKMGTGDPQMAVEGFGQALASALQALLLSKTFGPAPVEAPAPPAEWQGPIQPQGPPTPPPEFQGPMPEPQGPQLPQGRTMMGPKPPMATPAQRYGPKAFPDWQGPIEPQGPQQPAPPWQGPIEPQGPKMPESVVVRGLNPKNAGWFSKVKTSDVDPDILRRHLNAREELTAEALKKTAKAPKPPTKTTPKGKK